MEVHAHTHTARKKWTHYFWKFLMLFLAVFCGFLAENQREHMVEHQRAKKYAAALYKDLVKDTSVLNQRIEALEETNANLDSIIELLTNKNHTSSFDRIYALSGYAFGSLFFPATTSTINQLKNSGSVRYFSGTELIDNFNAYDAQLESLKGLQESNIYIQEEIRKFLSQFLNLKYLPRFKLINETQQIVYEHTAVPAGVQKIYQADNDHLRQYANLCSLKQSDYDNKLRWLKGTQKLAEKLIQSLKNDFDMK